MVKNPVVTFIIVARNAGRSLPGILGDLVLQDFPKADMEFVFVDGMSEDGTMALVGDFAAAHPELNFRLLENPGKILSSGWNVALAQAKGDIILRVDAHARIPADFIAQNVKAISGGQDIVGGPRITRLPEQGMVRFLSLVEVSRFGAGAASYRNLGAAGFVDTLAHAAYHRDVFAKVGGYNECLVRTEDNEIHERMKKAGYKFWYTPEIRSEHTARPDLRGLLKQKFGNGYWIALTMPVEPGCFSARHFIPFIFLVAVLAGVAALFFGAPEPLYLLLLTYGAAASFFSVKAVSGEAIGMRLMGLFMPAVFFVMHLAYGFGTLWGLLKLPFSWRRLRSHTRVFPVGKRAD